jgi:hypothetical protein
MDTSQPYPSLFAQMVDKLRTKSEAELKMLYMQIFATELKNEWQDITAEAGFKETSEEDIIKAIQQKRYKK